MRLTRGSRQPKRGRGRNELRWWRAFLPPEAAKLQASQAHSQPFSDQAASLANPPPKSPSSKPKSKKSKPKPHCIVRSVCWDPGCGGHRNLMPCHSHDERDEGTRHGNSSAWVTEHAFSAVALPVRALASPHRPICFLPSVESSLLASSPFDLSPSPYSEKPRALRTKGMPAGKMYLYAVRTNSCLTLSDPRSTIVRRSSAALSLSFLSPLYRPHGTFVYPHIISHYP